MPSITPDAILNESFKMTRMIKGTPASDYRIFDLMVCKNCLCQIVKQAEWILGNFYIFVIMNHYGSGTTSVLKGHCIDYFRRGQKF